MITDLLLAANAAQQAGGGLVTDIDPAYMVSDQNADGSYVAPGFMGVFRNGLFQEFDQHGTFSFTVPDGVTKLRVRAVGRGGVGAYVPGYAINSGAGGGYAHGVFDVTPGEVFEIKIPSFKYNTFTETSFGNAIRGLLLRATNGGVTYGVPGVGYGGDYQSTGGKSGSPDNASAHGLGAAGSQIKKVSGSGNIGANASLAAGGGVGGNSAYGSDAHPGGAAGPGTSTLDGPGVSLVGLALPSGFPRFKWDGFWGAAKSGLPGGGANNTFPVAGLGAGSYFGRAAVNGDIIYGSALPPSYSAYKASSTMIVDGKGLVVIEW